MKSDKTKHPWRIIINPDGLISDIDQEWSIYHKENRDTLVNFANDYMIVYCYAIDSDDAISIAYAEKGRIKEFNLSEFSELLEAIDNINEGNYGRAERLIEKYIIQKNPTKISKC